MPATEFTLATISQDAHGKPHPCARTCIFRSFWADLKLRDSARAELQRQDQASDETTGTAAGTNKNVEQNAALYDSDMLSFTTDVRMDKVGHIMSGGGDEDGGGGEVECVFWVKAVSTQWRLKGRASVVGASSEDNVEKKSREEIWQWMRTRSTHNVSPSGKAAESWSWEKEITAHFANLSPIMRGNVCLLCASVSRILLLGNNVQILHATLDLKRIFRCFIQTMGIDLCIPLSERHLPFCQPLANERAHWSKQVRSRIPHQENLDPDLSEIHL